MKLKYKFDDFTFLVESDDRLWLIMGSYVDWETLQQKAKEEDNKEMLEYIDNVNRMIERFENEKKLEV